MFQRITLTLLCFIATLALSANNIQVTNISLTDQNATAQTTVVQFDLSWDNSWRISVGPANYDAAWIFAKYRVGGGPWRHATLSGVGAVPAGASVDVADAAGAFVYRSADGNGSVDFADLQLVWDYGNDNVDDAAVVDIQVFAIEMVYVPEASFQVGTGPSPSVGVSDEEYEFFTREVIFGSLTVQRPYIVGSEDAITIDNSVGNLYYEVGGTLGGDQLGPVPAAFPKGFTAFYCMKYEISQAQYVAYFNTLTDNQKITLDLTKPDGKNSDEDFRRNGVSWPDAGNATTSLPDVACNYISNEIMYSYMDWAALRPMTELEFEKACRGTAAPVGNEFAWGSASVSTQAYNLANAGQPGEVVTNPGVGTGNLHDDSSNNNFFGPVRCGIFAASAVNPTREETGGSYYGIMELSGNLYERLIPISLPEFRAFTGIHGDGALTSTGLANVTDWPVNSDRTAFRGGSYRNSADFSRVSDRSVTNDGALRGNDRLGARGVRTAN